MNDIKPLPHPEPPVTIFTFYALIEMALKGFYVLPKGDFPYSQMESRQISERTKILLMNRIRALCNQI